MRKKKGTQGPWVHKGVYGIERVRAEHTPMKDAVSKPLFLQ
jgi:hypothetical protein